MSLKTTLLTSVLLAAASPALAQQAPMPDAMAQQGQRQSPFDRMDANQDGVITLEEVRIARTAAFTRADANRDGFLIGTEIPNPRMERRGERGEGPGRQGHQGGEMLARADVNNDGNVTRAEFDAAMSANATAKAGKAQERGAMLFARIDANNDGTITRAEAESARGQMPPRPPQGPNAIGRPPLDTNNDQKVSLAEWLAVPNPLFDRGDANKDGRVTREEAAAIVRQGRGQDGRPGRPW